MKNNISRVFGIAALSLAALSAQAATREEAQAMVKAALADIKDKGMDAAGKDINSGGSWNKGSLYLFVSDMKATVLAHSGNAKLIGKNLWEVKDATGKALMQEEVKIVQGPGNGLVTGRWMNPTTKQIDDAEIIVARVPGQDAFVGAVWYK